MPAAVVLVLANSVPLVASVVLKWEVITVLILFWLENVVVGVFNTLRLAMARKPAPGWRQRKIILIPYGFSLYAALLAAQGVAIIAIFERGLGQRKPIGDPFADVENRLQTLQHLIGDPTSFVTPHVSSVVVYALCALTISHAIAFGVNYIWEGRYRHVQAQDLLVQPIVRVVTLHVVLMAGAIVLQQGDIPQAALTLLFLVKMVLELYVHFKLPAIAGLDGLTLN